MSAWAKTAFLALVTSLTLCSCNQNEVDGIRIGHTLVESQSLSENRELRQLIRKTLNKDEKALAELCKFRCGGAAGCYDLGFVVTQIIYRMGEVEFSALAGKLTKEETWRAADLIGVGLEYGDNDRNGVSDDKKIETEFPRLHELIKASKRT